MKIFAERLKELRKEEKISTIKLAEKLGVKGPTVSRWENNKMSPSIDQLYKIAVYFKVSTDYLIGLED